MFVPQRGDQDAARRCGRSSCGAVVHPAPQAALPPPLPAVAQVAASSTPQAKATDASRFSKLEVDEAVEATEGKSDDESTGRFSRLEVD